MRKPNLYIASSRRAWATTISSTSSCTQRAWIRRLYASASMTQCRRSIHRPEDWHLYGRDAQVRTFASTHGSRKGHDERNRLSQYWTPSENAPTKGNEKDAAFSLLIRAGYIHQAHSGLFHLLPLGLRVQSKLSSLVDKHMRSINASKVSLSSITAQSLWRKSGRITSDLKPGSHEFLSVQDRRKSGFLLSPTHEEEITLLVRDFVKSYRDLPVRLYQITRKYRDELRPRQGLLRAKEFLMKDLYTFDVDKESALKTYEAICDAYRRFFDELGLPYLVAEADSGNMGGKLSHEYHFISPYGEDTVYSCGGCGYTANEEVVEKRAPLKGGEVQAEDYATWTGLTVDKSRLVKIYIPAQQSGEDVVSLIDLRAAQAACPTLNTSITTIDTTDLEPSSLPTTHLVDHRVNLEKTNLEEISWSPNQTVIATNPSVDSPLDLLKTKTGSACPRCESGTLETHRCIEVGHTFHLGTRYSEPLEAMIAAAPGADGKQSKTYLQMGCHGIGVSRLMGAIAAIGASPSGLRWPWKLAPFQGLVIAKEGYETDAESVYDTLVGRNIDAVVDDRDKPLGWKLKDAELVGYPLTVILGKQWAAKQEVEVISRLQETERRELIHVDKLAAFCSKHLL